MQWHPIFAHLLRPLVESHYEVRTDQPVGDLPRSSDVVLLRKTSASPPPFQGLWRRLTPWNVLEYKGPTVSPRFDELHDLIELGLGIHRRLNELQRKQQAAEVDYPDVSFWYLVNHLGGRFLAEAPSYLPGMQQEAEGIWRATVFAHPVFLVSVQELHVERDSMALHVLAGVPEAQRGTIVEALKAEPALWPMYQAWLALREPAIWKEVSPMNTGQQEPIPLDLSAFAEYLRQNQAVQRMVETIGVKQAVEAVGVKQVVEAVGVEETLEAIGEEQIWAKLSPQRRENLRRLVQQDNPTEKDQSK